MSLTWKMAAHQGEASVGKVARRRHRILRLLSYAQAQGAAPTHSHLAEVLDVSRRTIERDMAVLRARENTAIPHQKKNVAIVCPTPCSIETLAEHPYAKLPLKIEWQLRVIGGKAMAKRRAQQESFVVRVWWEPGRPELKGWVQHTRSGDSATLQTLGELIAFIERRTAGPAHEEQGGLK